MNITKQYAKQLSLILSIPALTTFYQILNKPGKTVYCLATEVDKIVPFLKVFILPYLGFYPYIFIALCYFCYKDKRTYYKSLLAINLSYLLCYMIYFFFQTTVPRPSVGGNDLISHLVSFIYRIDKPYNAFPSIHVLTSFLMIKAVNNCPGSGKIAKTIIYFFSIIVIISTQFVKQHVIFDLGCAILLGDVTFEMTNFIFESNIKTWVSKKKAFINELF